MKPFNLEEAKAGKRIVSYTGKPLKFIAHVPEVNEVVVLLNETILTYYEDGDGVLFMHEETRKIGDAEYPAPEIDYLIPRTRYYVPSVIHDALYYTFTWIGSNADMRRQHYGLVHLTKENAVKHAEAILLAQGTLNT